MSEHQFTAEEIQNMRMIIAQEDKKVIGEIDLNNPPKKPYTHQEFPKMMYHHATGRDRVAHTAADEKAALEAGWSTKPLLPQPAVAPEPEQEAPWGTSDASETDNTTNAIRRPGRPRKDASAA